MNSSSPGGTPRLPPCPIPSPPPDRALEKHAPQGLPPPPPGTAAPSGQLGAPMLHTLPLPPPQPAEGRDAKGRFAPGNPGGTPGRRHKVTAAMESLIEGQWETLANTALQMALRGDSTMLKACMDRLAPVRRGSSVTIPDFPAVASIADVPRAQAALLAAVAAGHCTADEAVPLSALLTAYINAVDIVDTAAEVAEIKRMQEEAHAKGR